MFEVELMSLVDGLESLEAKDGSMGEIIWRFHVKCVSDSTDDWIVSSLIGSPPLLCTSKEFHPKCSLSVSARSS